MVDRGLQRVHRVRALRYRQRDGSEPLPNIEGGIVQHRKRASCFSSRQSFVAGGIDSFRLTREPMGNACPPLCKSALASGGVLGAPGTGHKALKMPGASHGVL